MVSYDGYEKNKKKGKVGRMNQWIVELDDIQKIQGLGYYADQGMSKPRTISRRSSEQRNVGNPEGVSRIGSPAERIIP